MAIHGNFIGSGVLFLRDTSGNAYPAGQLTDVSIDVTNDVKELIADKKYAVLTAETAKKVAVKAGFAQLSSALVSAVMGGTSATGSKRIGTVSKTFSGSSATVAAADVGNPAGFAFVSDLGVAYQTTGQPLKYNSGTLAATGEYKNTAAVYSSGSGEATLAAAISFLYSITAGEASTISNTAIGLSTYFSLYLQEQTTQADGTVRTVTFKFNAVSIPKLSLGFKNTDFVAQDLELSVFPDAAGVVGEMSVS